MPNKDDDLLARLNALKPSSIKLDPADPVIDVQTSSPQTVEDKLAERLKTLRSGGKPEPVKTSQPVKKTASSTVASTIERAQDEVVVERDPIRHWQQQDGDEQSIEDLLAELEANGQWRLDPEEPKNVQALLKEARDALPKDDAEAGGKDVGTNEKSHPDHAEAQPDDESAEKNEDEQDEADADDYIARVLAELDIEEKYGGGDKAEEPEPEATPPKTSATSNNLDLPSTPSQLKSLPTTSNPEPPSYEDSELEARFSQLGVSSLGLPSTPTSQPSSRPKVVASLKPKAKTNLPTYTDEDIDSWCCICNEDGELRCLGCDGDLYCQSCWADGHGEGPGKEKGHRAVQFSRKGPRAAVA
ncbi:putative ANCHR, B-box-type 1 zinc finger domain-containing protein [Septoria linicola]|nr:putative ANCHR, B-box-type 1 zinc finger domain-containing protein [Septoria linicola]